MADFPDPLGKRALFGPAGRPPASAPGHRATAQQGKRALYTAPVEQLQELADAAGRHPARPSVGGILGQVHLECGSCGARSEVDVIRSLLLRMPIPLILPGRGPTHLMVCPACRRRTWVSASWRPFTH